MLCGTCNMHRSSILCAGERDCFNMDRAFCWPLVFSLKRQTSSFGETLEKSLYSLFLARPGNYRGLKMMRTTALVARMIGIGVDNYISQTFIKAGSAAEKTQGRKGYKI